MGFSLDFTIVQGFRPLLKRFSLKEIERSREIYEDVSVESPLIYLYLEEAVKWLAHMNVLLCLLFMGEFLFDNKVSAICQVCGLELHCRCFKVQDEKQSLINASHL